MHTEFRIRVRPVAGTYTETSFTDLLQRAITFPGLDPRHWNVLIGVQHAPDYSWAELTVRSEPQQPMSLDVSLRPAHGTPPARVRAFSIDGELIHEGAHPAPLGQGQLVAVGDTHYEVANPHWPHRDPDTGVCNGQLDWQHVTLIELAQSHPEPALAAEQPPSSAAESPPS